MRRAKQCPKCGVTWLAPSTDDRRPGGQTAFGNSSGPLGQRLARQVRRQPPRGQAILFPREQPLLAAGCRPQAPSAAALHLLPPFPAPTRPRFSAEVPDCPLMRFVGLYTEALERDSESLAVAVRVEGTGTPRSNRGEGVEKLINSSCACVLAPCCSAALLLLRPSYHPSLSHQPRSCARSTPQLSPRIRASTRS